jgi:HAE1 family hydrophobic/amphiphilic exporter-1
VKVAEYTRKVYDQLKTTPGFTDVDMDLDVNSPEFQIGIDRQRASDLGVRASDIASAVRLMIAGEDEISTYKEADEQYPVTIQLLPEQQRDPNVLARLMIPSAKVGQVRLDNIATIQRGLSPAKIKRYNRQFQVGVMANLTSDTPLDVAAQKVREAIASAKLPPGYSSRFSGTVKILDDTNKSLIITFLLASIFMYMVLAAQFESLLHPLAIMVSLPLSIPFALLTLWLTGRTLNLWSSLGVLLLLGIVKKNGILQVDYANKLRHDGMPLRQAILEACQVRLRPILMTTFSIIGGLIPTAIGVGAGAAQRSAIAVTIIGGQTLCLLLTLIVTPVAYLMLSQLSEMKVSGATSRLRLGTSRFFGTFLH